MTLHRIEFTAEFITHLRLLGVRGVPGGSFLVDEATRFEPPVDLHAAYVFDAPVTIGAFSYLGVASHVTAVEIGRYCSIAKSVQIGMTRHPPDRLTTSPVSWMRYESFDSFFESGDLGWERALPFADYDARPRTRIGNDVWIGASAWIKDGITIGDGAIVGAHSVVTRDVPPYAIVVGNPGRMLRLRFPEPLVERLLAARWWDYNLLELELDLTAPERALDQLAAQAEAGLDRYAPEPIHLVAEYRRFKKVQRMLRRQAA